MTTGCTTSTLSGTALRRECVASVSWTTHSHTTSRRLTPTPRSRTLHTTVRNLGWAVHTEASFILDRITNHLNMTFQQAESGHGPAKGVWEACRRAHVLSEAE